jgi:hypothetical protein
VQNVRRDFKVTGQVSEVYEILCRWKMEKVQAVGDGSERKAEVGNFTYKKVRARNLDALKGRREVKVILGWEWQAHLKDRKKFAGFFEQPAHKLVIAAEGYPVGPPATHLGDATVGNHLPYLVKARLLAEILWVDQRQPVSFFF